MIRPDPDRMRCWACQSCGRVDADLPCVAVSSVTTFIERRVCRACISRLRADPLTIVEEIDGP